MKLYYVANARMPSEKAHGIQLAKMCEAFVEQGVDLELIVPNVPNVISASMREYYGLRGSVKVKRLPVLNIATSSSLGFNIRSLSFALSTFVHLSAKYLRGERDAIVYTIDLDQFSFFSLPFTGFSVFLEAHGAKLSTFFTRKFFRLVDGVVANSRGTATSLLKTFALEDSRVLIAQNGVDMRLFANLPRKRESRNKLGLPQDKKIILYVGRFYNWKGLDIIARAAPFVPNDVYFVLVGGDGDEYRAASGVSLPSSARAVGGRPFGEIPLWLASADTLLVLGTNTNEYSQLETSPMKLFEYMASRKPIIASQTPANREVITDSEVFFYEPDDERSLAATIANAVLDKATADSKADSAYSEAKNHTWALRADKILKFISPPAL